MVGYVPEAQGFALELTYNYGLDSYAFGNDLQYIAVHSPVALRRAAALGFPVSEPEGIIRGPDNYNFKVIPAIPGRAELFVCVAIRVSNLAASVAFWSGVLGMHEVPPHVVPRGLELPASASASALLTFNDNDTYLQFIEVRGRWLDIYSDFLIMFTRIPLCCTVSRRRPGGARGVRGPLRLRLRLRPGRSRPSQRRSSSSSSFGGEK